MTDENIKLEAASKSTKAAKISQKTNTEEMSEFVKTAVIAILLAVIIRTFLYEPFNIPSGSMKPTLLVGDYLFVSKPAYGYSRYSFPFGLGPFKERQWAKPPTRGDVIVFKLPTNTSVDYIKRLVGMPGDRIQVKNGRLYINGKLVPRRLVGTREVETSSGYTQIMTEYIETLPGGFEHSIFEETDQGDLDNTSIYIVPKGHYFFMGDNRDNSQDSRVSSLVGYVPFENFVGRADRLFFSANGKAQIFEPWKWPWGIRYNRLFDKIR